MKEKEIQVLQSACPGNYWFGYYDVSPWSMDEKSFLCMRADFMDRPPKDNDIAELLLFREADNFTDAVKLGETLAWNWQMGCRLQWDPLNPNSAIYYNDRRNNRFVCVRHDLLTGREKIMEDPIYALSRDGKYAATLDFSRLHDCRPGYGYHGFADRNSEVDAPDDDGLYVINMVDEKKTLILSIQEIVDFEHSSEMDGCKHWINHILWGPGDCRILFLHRWMDKNNTRITRLMTVSPDGTGLRCLGKSPIISHFDWQHKNHILIWAKIEPYPEGLYMIEETTGKIKRFEEDCFYTDGHCSWSPDKKCIATDTYPSPIEKIYHVFLYSPKSRLSRKVTVMRHPLKYRADCRCDLHPRWNRSGDKICFDAVLNGSRKVCIADVKAEVDVVNELDQKKQNKDTNKGPALD